MIIPNKYSGYQAGIRVYPGGGGGGGQPGMGDSPVNPPTSGGGWAPIPVTPPAPVTAPWGNTQQSKGDWYNQQLSAGSNDAQIRSSVEANPLGGPQSGSDWSQLVQTAGMQSPTGRPLAGSAQFYQPIQQQQYQNYNMGNPMSVSQYGQGFGGFNPYMMQMQTPFNPYTNNFGYGGYGMQQNYGSQFQPQMGMQTPFSYGGSQPMQPTPQRVSSGPAQAIVSRSAGLRGTPNVMRRAEGGITSLMDAE